MRDNSISIAKGIAIILMVLGHADCPDFINKYLSMMRMPLFFFMSGYCFKIKYLDDERGYLKKRVTGIYWPYLKWSLFFLLIHNICFRLNIYSDEYGFIGRMSSLYTFSDFINHAISIVTKMKDHEQLVGGFWFLKSLFVGSVIFYATMKLLKGSQVGMVLLLLLSLLLVYMNWKIPYFQVGHRECLAAFYLYCGHLYKRYKLNWHHHTWLNIVFVVIVGIGSVYWPASMLRLTFAKMLPYVVTSIMGLLVIFNIGQHLSQCEHSKIKQFLVYVGNYTFNVLTWHFLSMKLVSFMLIAIYGLPIKRLSEFPVIEEYARQGWWIAYLIVGVAVPVIWTYYYHLFKDRLMNCSANKSLS